MNSIYETLGFNNFNLSQSFLVSILVLILMFLISCMPIFFIFKTYNLNEYLAFIPIYGTYRLLENYRFKVYNFRWASVYLVSIGLFFASIFYIFIVFLISMILGNEIYFVYFFLLYLLVLYILNVMILIIKFAPIFYNKKLRLIYSLVIIVYIGSLGLLILWKKLNDYSYMIFLIYILFYTYLTIFSYILYKKVKKGELKLVPNRFSNLDSYLEFKHRKKEKFLGRILFFKNNKIKEDNIDNR